MNSFWLLQDYIFANDFLRFLTGQKNVKSHVFLKSEKNVKYVFSNTGTNYSSVSKDLYQHHGDDVFWYS